LTQLAEQIGLAGLHIQQGMAAARNGERYHAELQRINNGQTQLLRINFAPIIDESEKMLGYVQTLQDITERKQATEALQQSASIFEHTLDGIIVTDAAGTIVTVNPAFVKITGYSEAEVLGKKPALLRSGRHDRFFYQRMWEHISQAGYWQGEIWNRRKNGDVFAEWLTINAIKDSEQNVVKYIGVFADITALKNSQEKYEFLAHHDPLTGLPNRLLCYARIEQALRHGKRHNDQVAVMMLDIDNFKPVNDNYGHQSGDRLLQEIAKRLAATLRCDDTAARLGGDEFVVVLESVRSHADAAVTAEKLVRVISESYTIENFAIQVSVSIGIAISPGHGEEVETLLKHADKALYQVKADGRNAYRFYQQDSNERA
jgi:diguanylate cyclase (GGDEF)-like protein/PAS domain S-box-containing protein